MSTPSPLCTAERDAERAAVLAELRPARVTFARAAELSAAHAAELSAALAALAAAPTTPALRAVLGELRGALAAAHERAERAAALAAAPAAATDADQVWLLAAPAALGGDATLGAVADALGVVVPADARRTALGAPCGPVGGALAPRRLAPDRHDRAAWARAYALDAATARLAAWGYAPSLAGLVAPAALDAAAATLLADGDRAEAWRAAAAAALAAARYAHSAAAADLAARVGRDLEELAASAPRALAALDPDLADLAARVGRERAELTATWAHAPAPVAVPDLFAVAVAAHRVAHPGACEASVRDALRAAAHDDADHYPAAAAVLRVVLRAAPTPAPAR